MLLWPGLLGADKTGKGHSGSEGRLLLGHAGQRVKCDRGRPANR